MKTALPRLAISTTAPPMPTTSAATAAVPAASPPSGGGCTEAARAELARRGVRLVVWDFDLTVLAIHSFGQRITPEGVGHRSLAADFKDLAFFTALVPDLVHAGVAVAIASFGHYAVIQEYLNRAFSGPGIPPPTPSAVAHAFGPGACPECGGGDGSPPPAAAGDSSGTSHSPATGGDSSSSGGGPGAALVRAVHVVGGLLSTSSSAGVATSAGSPGSKGGARTSSGSAGSPRPLACPACGRRLADLARGFYFGRCNVSTPSVVPNGADGFSLPEGKNKQLELLAKAAGLEPREVLFFDDDNVNIGYARDAGYLAVHCDRGFSRDAWAAAFDEDGGGGSGGGAGGNPAIYHAPRLGGAQGGARVAITPMAAAAAPRGPAAAAAASLPMRQPRGAAEAAAPG